MCFLIGSRILTLNILFQFLRRKPERVAALNTPDPNSLTDGNIPACYLFSPSIMLSQLVNIQFAFLPPAPLGASYLSPLHSHLPYWLKPCSNR